MKKSIIYWLLAASPLIAWGYGPTNQAPDADTLDREQLVLNNDQIRQICANTISNDTFNRLRCHRFTQNGAPQAGSTTVALSHQEIGKICSKTVNSDTYNRLNCNRFSQVSGSTRTADSAP